MTPVPQKEHPDTSANQFVPICADQTLRTDGQRKAFLGRLGHATKLKWNAPGEWIWSQEPVQEPLIGIGAFEQVQALLRARGPATERSPRRTPRGYALRGIVRCAACGRKMQGSWNNGKAHYRCNLRWRGGFSASASRRRSQPT